MSDITVSLKYYFPITIVPYKEEMKYWQLIDHCNYIIISTGWGWNMLVKKVRNSVIDNTRYLYQCIYHHLNDGRPLNVMPFLKMAEELDVDGPVTLNRCEFTFHTRKTFYNYLKSNNILDQWLCIELVPGIDLT